MQPPTDADLRSLLDRVQLPGHHPAVQFTSTLVLVHKSHAYYLALKHHQDNSVGQQQVVTDGMQSAIGVACFANTAGAHAAQCLKHPLVQEFCCMRGCSRLASISLPLLARHLVSST